jgi:hypothetical protein
MRSGGAQIEKRVLMPHLQNTTPVGYRLLSRGPVRLELRPFLAFRLHDAPVSHPVAAPYVVRAVGNRSRSRPAAICRRFACFFTAVQRYLAATGDRSTLRQLLPTLTSIVEHHLRGTRFGIAVDEADGLLRQGQEGYQLTWMDAKVEDWVVTPRRGKAVEINALWFNALRLPAGWLREEGDPRAPGIDEWATRAYDAFNEIFDAEEPYTARGCIAQAWSVAEALRASLLTAPASARAPRRAA